MFERFTEHARRAIFYARLEASVYGSPYIESEHLLLGLLREDPVVRMNLPVEAVRKELERLGHREKPTSTAMDLPLSFDGKRAIAYCAEEAEFLHHKHIDCGHLLVGLTRVEESLAARVLRQHGVSTQEAREIVRRSPPRVAPEPQKGSGTLTATVAVRGPGPPPEPIAASLDAVTEKFESLIQSSYSGLNQVGESEVARKQALGHLIDWTIAHHRWFARSLTETQLVATEYPDRELSKAQHYETLSWNDLVQSWISMSRLMAHLLAQIPEEKLDTPCQIGGRDPIPLWKVVTQYVEHCEDVLGQILG